MTATFKPDYESRIWSFGILCVAAMSAPFVIPAAFAIAAAQRLMRCVGLMAPDVATRVDNKQKPRTAIVTGGKMTKSLQVARILKNAGMRVVMVETHKYYMVASRFSKCVDRFITVPVPEQNPAEYLSNLKVLAYEEDAELFVPVSAPVASVHDARVARVLPPGCRSLSTGEALTASLDDKVTFAEMAKMAGLPAPDTRRMASEAAVHKFNDELRAQGDAAKKYIFKNLAYDSMHRLDLFTLPCEPAKLSAYCTDLSITPESPWAVQEWLVGTEHSTCALGHEGAMTMYTDNVASISCFNYKHANVSAMRSWVERFLAYHRISGVVCIDFFVDADGKAHAMECNPRFSSNILNFYNSPSVGRAFLQPEECAANGETQTPLPTARESCWTAVELYYALTKPGLTLGQRAYDILDALLFKKDAYFDADNVLPFLALHYIHIPTLLVRNIIRGNRWAKIDMCIGKLTEENGD